MGSKIIADVSSEVKSMLSDIAHARRCSMKDVVIDLIEKEYKKSKPKTKK